MNPPPRARAVDLAGLRQRHPEAFRTAWAGRLAAVGTVAALLGLAAFAMVRLDFSGARIVHGLGRLGEFSLMMLPPSSGGRLPDFLHALGETLAIAFLGTLVAALVAFPVAFLAAKTVVANPFAHVAVRRGLDVIRSVDVLIWALIWINVVG
ncbi:PhnE/PtxC family ABC transporter permease, partial [uncultured Methylobacterium sp.]|uniref:PhnE/PtxC family ABC transporter permease n=1 Tax=uncultured Methylobacterium sp. TaxID=157278 RepID=UPI0035CC6ABE